MNLVNVCPYCKKEFHTDQYNKKYCSYAHGMRYNQLKLVKEPYNLDSEEREIWKEIQKQKKEDDANKETI